MVQDEMIKILDEVELSAIDVNESDIPAIDVAESEVSVIDVREAEAVTIEVDEVLVSLDGDGQQLNHALLNNRETPNQHPIIAIEGLRQELDNIEKLQTIYSDKKQQADYYAWRQDDAHLLPENPYGLFVSICPETNQIQICDGTRDVFGVTVADAAFVGNQEYAQAEGGTKIGRDGNYALVANYGLVAVRRMPSVVVGDYVVPNSRGEAQKSDGNYGYLVTAVSDADGLYALISLATPSTLTQTLADTAKDLSERMTAAEHNITSAVNVANSAYATAQSAKELTDASIESIGGKVNDALGRVEAVEGTVGNLSESVKNACQAAALAKVTAEGAVSSAEAIRSEAVGKANEANVNVNNLIKELEPITTWRDPETGNTGAEYLTTYINDGLATKIEVQAVETKTDEAFSAIEQNAKNIQSLVSTIDKYAVGEYSQSYGLTQDQAKSILKEGYIYIPTIKHDGEHIYNSTEFQLGYYYEWDGEKWMPSASTAVSFSSEFIQGAEATPYWVVTESDVVKDGTTYDLGGLYKWEVDTWVKVAAVADNTLSRAVSNIRQTTNSITAEVSNVKGDVSALDIRVEGAESSLTTLTTWQGEANDYMTAIEQKADENGASIAQVVSAVGKDGEVTASSIVQAINDGKSSVAISGDYINLKGKVTFESFSKETQDKIEADTIDVQIWSSRGNIFKSRDVETTLTCHVFKAGVDITDTLDNSAFTWIKINNDGTQDENWMATPYGNHVNPIQISPNDIFSRAVFTCKVEI